MKLFAFFTLQLGIRLSIQPFPTGGGRADGQTCGKKGTSSTEEEGDSPIDGEGPPNSHWNPRREKGSLLAHVNQL